MKYLLFLLLLTTPFMLVAQSQCDSSVEAAPGSTGYRSRGAHCEGFYRSLVSATDLQLIHFTKGKLKYSATEAENLKLSIPVNTNMPVNVRSMGIPRSLFYRMDVQLSLGETFNWNTGSILLKNKSTKYARFIGLLGFVESSSNRTYLPVQVNNSSEGYQLKFVASSKVQQLKWRISGQTSFRMIRGGRMFNAGQAISISLPGDLEPGTYTLEIKGYEDDGVEKVGDRVTIRL